MEFSTFQSDLDEKEIKPNDLMTTYVSLVAKDIERYFKNSISPHAAVDTEQTVCPACDARGATRFAEKLGFRYVRCSACETVFTNTVPLQSELNGFYRTSRARAFWLDEIWSKTAATRAEKILEPLKSWVETSCSEHLPPASVSGRDPRLLSLAEVYPSNWGFASLWGGEVSLELVDPLFSGGPKGLDARIQVGSHTSERAFDAICFLETLGRVESPLAELDWARGHLKDGGLCFVTAVLSTGFDTLVLGASSDALLPPDRMTLFSYEGIQLIARRAGFEVLELSTPGVLDLSHVYRAMKNGVCLPDVIRHWMETRFQDRRFVEDFQVFLQSHGLSSQGRIVLQKKSV